MSDTPTAAAPSEHSNPVTVIDGGMGKELRRIGAPFRQPEWSALALMEAPDYVIEAHRNFIDAGAELIITNNYAVVPFHLGDERFSASASELITLAGRLARRAADDAGRPIRVAGSLPPLFGSYLPDMFDPVRAPDIYDLIVGELEPFVDLWVAETLSRVDEMSVIADSVERHGGGKPLWVGFALPEEFGAEITLRSGDTIADIVGAAGHRADLIEALLFNCSRPEQITLALRQLGREITGADLDMRFGAYANAFPETNRDPDYSANNTILERREDVTPSMYADVVDGWVRDGATIIGGCCDMYPEHIEALARRFGRGRLTAAQPTN